jgi:hypothetical protein
VPILVGAGLAVGGSTAAWGLDDKNRPPWRVFKVTSLTWTVSEDAVTDDESCRTPVRLVGKSSPFYVGTPPVARPHLKGWVRFAKTAGPLFFHGSRVPSWDLRLRVPATMTLTIGATTCDPPANLGSCAGTYRSRGGVIGAISWHGRVRSFPAEFNWSHKITAPQPLPPQSCGRYIGEQVFGYFYSGLYHPVGGGAFENPGGPKNALLPRSRLLAGKPFATHLLAPVAARATFAPVHP